MTGPEHYQEAERLLVKYCGTAEDAIGHGMLAQAHAMLAQTAATMELVGATVNGVVSPGWSEAIA